MGNYMTGGSNQLMTPTETRHSKRLKNQPNNRTSDTQGFQERTHTPTQLNQHRSSTVSKLPTSLGERDDELELQRHRYRSLEGNFRKAQNENKRLKNETQALKSTSEDTENRYYNILFDTIVPYAHHKGLRINSQTGEPIDDVLGPLLRDALRADSLRDEVQGLSNQNQALREQTQKTQGRNQNLRKQIQEFQNTTQDHTLRQQIQDFQSQNQILRQQVHDLQKDALDKVDKIQVISDNQFEREFQTIAASIKALSRMIRVTEQIDVAQILTSPTFLSNVHSHHWEGRPRKKCFIEAWVWAALVELLFRGPFVVFGEHGKDVGKTWTHIFGKDHHHEWPAPSFLCEQWRCTTAEYLRESTGGCIDVCGEVEPMPKRAKLSVADPRDAVANIIEAHLHSVAPDSNLSPVRTIIDKAFALAMQMSLQRSRLQITYPAVGSAFLKKEMTPVPDRDGEDVQEGIVAFVVNPGLAKWGDARGMMLDQRHDIVPALVQLKSTVRVKLEPEE